MKLFNPNFPFSPKKFQTKIRIFYGWIIVVAGSILILASSPGQTAGVSAFTEDLLKALSLSRLEFTNAYLVGTLLSASLLPFAGRWLDRIGSRKMSIIATSGLSLGLVFLSASSIPGKWVAKFPDLGIYLSFIYITISFATIRFFGQGILAMTGRTMVSKWFEKKRGLVSGIQGILTAYGFSVTPYLFNEIIGIQHQWEQAFLILAVTVGIGVAVFSWLFSRDTPEKCGLWMDGRKASAPEETKSKDFTAQIHGMPPKEVFKTPAFWLTSLTLAAHALIFTGLTFHITDIGASFDLPRDEIMLIFLPIAGFSTLIGILVGILADRVPLKYLFAFMMAGLAIGTAAFTGLGNETFRIIAIGGIGISSGCFGPLSMVALPHYFGRRYLGAITGMQAMSMVAGSALGPSFFVILYNWGSSYEYVFYMNALIPTILAALLFFITRKPFQE